MCFVSEKMAELEGQRMRRASIDLLGRCVISFVSASLTQLALFVVVVFFPFSSLFTLLSLSALVLLAVAGAGRCCKRLLRVRASAPAFVFFNIIFVWSVYIGVIRQVISPLMDIIINAELLMLIIGLRCMLLTDPGYITHEHFHLNKLEESRVSEPEAHSKEWVHSSCDVLYELSAEENSIPLQRVRYCRACKLYVKGFDHHCPAFGNCIGQKNRVLFVVLLFGFVVTGTSYIACSSQFATKILILDKPGGQTSLSRNLAISTMLFCLLQVLWQVVFLAWHMYCVCFNIRTDEWINWKRYPEFCLSDQHGQGQISRESETKFTNPYNKGILWNLKEFLTGKD